jgi:hypothetical protein
MFRKPIHVKSDVLLRSQEIRTMTAALERHFPTSFHDALASILAEHGKKKELHHIKASTHGGDMITIYSCRQQPLWVQTEAAQQPVPTGQVRFHVWEWRPSSLSTSLYVVEMPRRIA